MGVELKLSTKEAAKYLGVSISTLYRMESQNVIRASKTPGGQRRFNTSDLDSYLRNSSALEAPQNPYKFKAPHGTLSEVKEEVQSNLLESEEIPAKTVDPRNQLNELLGSEWIQETKSVWFQKGLGSKHEHAQIERQHPAPFSYQDVKRLIEFFTKSEQKVLDPFSGVASTLKACALTNRRGVGIELSKHWNELGKKRLDIEVATDASNTQTFITGDSRHVLREMPDKEFHFIVTSPPYWNILNKKADHKVKQERIANDLATNYSDMQDDLGNIQTYGEFLDELTRVFSECYRVLIPNKYMAVVVSDFRHKNVFVPFHADLIGRLTCQSELMQNPFELQGIKVLVQNNKKLYPYGYPFSYVENIHHQYILIFKRPKA